MASVGTITRLEAIGLFVLFVDDVPRNPSAHPYAAVQPLPPAKLSVVTWATTTAFGWPVWTTKSGGGLSATRWIWLDPLVT